MELPVRCKLEELLDECLEAVARLSFFPAAFGRAGKLSRRPFIGTDAAIMLKGGSSKLNHRLAIRLAQSGQPASRIWKMTAPLKPFSESPGRADSRTTKICQRSG